MTPAAPVMRAVAMLIGLRGGRDGKFERFPVADRKLPGRKLPNHHALAGQAILPGSELTRQTLSSRERARVVLRDHVHGALKRHGQVRREARSAPPTHALERENVAEAIAEQEHVRGRLWLPRLFRFVLHLMHEHRLRLKELLLVGQLEHVYQVSHSRDWLFDGVQDGLFAQLRQYPEA